MPTAIPAVDGTTGAQTSSRALIEGRGHRPDRPRARQSRIHSGAETTSFVDLRTDPCVGGLQLRRVRRLAAVGWTVVGAHAGTGRYRAIPPERGLEPVRITSVETAPERDADRPRGPVRVTAALSYSEVGATCVVDPTWPFRPPGYRSHEQTTASGTGNGAGKPRLRLYRSGPSRPEVDSPSSPPRVVRVREVRQGQNYTLVASLGPFRLREPVQVVSVVEGPDRCGFAYGTRPGHPVTGEEAFIVHRRSGRQRVAHVAVLDATWDWPLAVRLSRRIGGPALVSPSLHACAGARLTGRGRFSHQRQTGNDMGRLRDRCPYPRLRPGP